MEIHYYGEIDDDNICIVVSQLSDVVNNPHMIELDTYNISLLGKMWTGSEWVDNPNPPEPPEPDEQPTNQDIMDMLTAMQGDQVPAATLDAAYREGVNSYAG